MPETFRQRLKRIADKVLAPAGLQLCRRDQVFDLDGLLSRSRARGCAPRTVVDIGASDGIWSLRAHRHFPEARFVLFEPLEERQAALAALRKRHGFEIVSAVAGESAGTAAFAVDPALDGSGVAEPGAVGTRAVPQTTIDETIARLDCPGPYLVKLDTHGYEVPVLTGADATLEQTQLLIVEAYNFTLTPGCLRFHELCAWLETRGFRCCDLTDPMRRPHDGTFWQVDLAFAKANDPMFTSNRYSG
jgi:FkbM family methyltransferase